MDRGLVSFMRALNDGFSVSHSYLLLVQRRPRDICLIHFGDYVEKCKI